MLNNYYVLQALGREWRKLLVGGTIEEAWSHAPGELTLAISKEGQFCMPSFLTHAPIIGAFRRPGLARPRRNAVSLFASLRGQRIKDVRAAEGDRVLTIESTGALSLQANLYGARANLFLLSGGGELIEQFRKGQRPKPRVANIPEDFEEFKARWQVGRLKAAKALATAMVFFDNELAQEAVARAGLLPNAAASLEGTQLEQLFDAAVGLHQELLQPRAHVYQNPDALVLIPLQARVGQPAEAFSTVDEAARFFAQRRLAQRAFQSAWTPRRKALVQALDRAQRSVERMRNQRTRKERADTYERFGHLIMAAHDIAAGADQVQLPDLYANGRPVDIPLDPALNRVQNAERYYKKARRAREADKHHAALLARAEAKAEKLAGQLEALQQVETLSELKAYDKAHGADGKTVPAAGTPFRRYDLAPGYQLWVGRNAQESESLTLRHARPFDLWLHARGVSGAHAILRLPRRQSEPSSLLLEKAAAIAAWHSKARGSAMVPVIVTPRKFVRKARGAAVGQVIVSQEDVLIVEPGLP